MPGFLWRSALSITSCDQEQTPVCVMGLAPYFLLLSCPTEST